MLSRIAFLGGLAAAGVAAPASAETSDVIRVGSNPNDPYAEPYYCADGGFFSKAGLSVELSTFPNGGPIIAAVAAGALDVGISNPAQIANAVEHGIPFVYFAGAALYLSSSPTSALCVATKSTILEAKDLVGKTIAVSSLKDTLNLATTEYLRKNGVDVSAVKFIEVPFSEMGAAVARGTVGAAALNEPGLTMALDSGDVRVLSHPFDALGTRLLSSGWFTTVEWYRQHVAVAKRLTAAIYDTARWANSNHDATAKILANHSKIDVVVARRMTRCPLAESLDPRLIDPILRVAARLKATSRLVTASEMIAKQ